jgi:TRAP transporter 4TM/12TM fusion protein
VSSAGGTIDRLTQRGLSALAIAFAAYMIYATFFGPYKTTLVHHALFLIVMMVIYFLDQREAMTQGYGWGRRLYDWLFAALVTVSAGYLILDFERLINLWGAMFLTPLDLAAGVGMVLVVLEAARRQSFAFFLLSLLSALYVMLGQYLPGVLQHPGMEFDRFIYLTAYTEEGIFGSGLAVAASYLFMFMLLSSALHATKTGDFMIQLANAGTGTRVGGPAKGAMFASAGLGTMVGSSIANVVSTGAFTIPLMKRVGFKPHVAGGIEVVVSEGSQLMPPVMGAGAFLMAELTGIPYASIALAAFLPAILYYVSTYLVIHIEALKMGIGGLSRDEVPDARQVLKDGWHLLVSPVVLLYLLMVENYTAGYAGIIAIVVALIIALVRRYSRYTWRDFINVFDDGVRQSAAVTGLVAAIGIVQQAMVTTGLGGRLADIILAASFGDPLLTALLVVVAATILGMGMPTPIAYLLLALFAAGAMEQAGFSKLASHLFIFYFAIKSGSTPPVAVVAVVAASIAKANWWKTGVVAFYYSLPGFVVAFMFLYSPALLFQGPWWEIALLFACAVVGVLGIAGTLQGWFGGWLTWPERAVLLLASLALVHPSLIASGAGIVVVAVIYALRRWALPPRLRPGIAAERTT